MNIRKLLVTNLYIIGGVVIISGFTWMSILAIVPDTPYNLMIAFTFTLSGIIFWGLGAHYAEKGMKQHVPRFLHHDKEDQ